MCVCACACAEQSRFELCVRVRGFTTRRSSCSPLALLRRHPSLPASVGAFALNCATQLQPALSESLDALSSLVGRVLNALESAQMAGDALANRAEKLETELHSSRREAEAEQAEAEELREGLREQTQELHRAEGEHECDRCRKQLC